ncbi:MAG: hypothetical protein LBI91_02330 [Spirochaetaceae bacterium]|jgi:hypothetical protein|nr:hypothetical protein [Spirochaetaceae bacterium]
MIRIEIVANHSVEENILEALKNEGVAKFYTKYTNVNGVGRCGPRMGDAIWPEENFALVIWCEPEEARGIERAINAVKKGFPDEGIKVFGMPDPDIPQYAVPSPGQPVYAPVQAPPLRERPEEPRTPPSFGGERF